MDNHALVLENDAALDSHIYTMNEPIDYDVIARAAPEVAAMLEKDKALVGQCYAEITAYRRLAMLATRLENELAVLKAPKYAESDDRHIPARVMNKATEDALNRITDEGDDDVIIRLHRNDCEYVAIVRTVGSDYAQVYSISIEANDSEPVNEVWFPKETVAVLAAMMNGGAE